MRGTYAIFSVCSSAIARFGVRLYHYCLMTNHVHLVVQLDHPRRLSSLMAGPLLA
jgi:REP element-mobilizing transposase RayT